MRNIKINGFSLAEILVVIAVVGVVGIIITDIFLSSIRGSNKASVIENIKRNGQTALESMDKTIRNSKLILCPILPLTGTTVSDYVIIQVQDGSYIRYRFSPTIGNNNGQILVDTPQPSATDINNLTSYCSSSTNITNQSSLTDANARTGVSIETSGFVTINTKEGYEDIITINFNVKPAVLAPKAYAGQVDAENFETTIGLR